MFKMTMWFRLNKYTVFIQNKYFVLFMIRKFVIFPTMMLIIQIQWSTGTIPTMTGNKPESCRQVVNECETLQQIVALKVLVYFPAIPSRF